MALSTQTVVITVVVQGGNAAQIMNNLGVTTNATGTRIQNATKHTNALSRAMGTLQKALLSMIGVLIAYNLLITLPEKIAQGLFMLGAAAIKTADEVSRQLLTIAGVINTFFSFGPTVEKSFDGAIKASQRLLVTFTKLAAESLATPQQMMMGFQTFLSRGGGAYVKSLDEAAKITKILVDATIALTQGQSVEKQIQTEIGSLMEGQARAGAVLARLIKARVGDLGAWLAKEKEAGTLLQSLQGMLGSLEVAGRKLGETPTGMINSIKGGMEMLDALAMQQGGLKPLLDILRSIRDAFGRTMTELLESPSSMSEASKRIILAFGMISAAVGHGVDALLKLVYAITQTNDPVEALTALIEKAANWMDKFAGIIDAFSDKWDKFAKDMKIAIDFMEAFGKVTQDSAQALEMLQNFVRMFSMDNIIDQMHKATVATRDWLEEFFSSPEGAKNAYVRLERAAAEHIPVIGGMFQDMLDWMFGAEQTEKLADRASKVVEAIKDALAGTGEAGTFIPQPGVESEAALKLITKMRREILLLQADNNEVLKIEAKRAEAAQEIVEKYGVVSKETEHLLALNQQLETAEKRALAVRTERGTLRDIANQIQMMLAGSNEYARLGVTIAQREQSILEKLEGQTQARKDALDLLKEQSGLEFVMEAKKGLEAAEMEYLRETQGEVAVILEQQRRDLSGIHEGFATLKSSRDEFARHLENAKPVVLTIEGAKGANTEAETAATKAQTAALQQQKGVMQDIVVLQAQRANATKTQVEEAGKKILDNYYEEIKELRVKFGLDSAVYTARLNSLNLETSKRLGLVGLYNVELGKMADMKLLQEVMLNNDKDRTDQAQKQVESAKALADASTPYGKTYTELTGKLQAITDQYRRQYNAVTAMVPSSRMTLRDKDALLDKLTAEYETQRKIIEEQIKGINSSKEQSAAVKSGTAAYIDAVNRGIELNRRMHDEKMTQLNNEFELMVTIATFGASGAEILSKMKIARDELISKHKTQLDLQQQEQDKLQAQYDAVVNTVRERDGLNEKLADENKWYAKELEFINKVIIFDAARNAALDYAQRKHEENLAALQGQVTEHGKAEIALAQQVKDEKLAALQAAANQDEQNFQTRLNQIQQEMVAFIDAQRKMGLARQAAGQERLRTVGGITPAERVVVKETATAAREVNPEAEAETERLRRAETQKKLDTERIHLMEIFINTTNEHIAAMDKERNVGATLETIENNRVAALKRLAEATKGAALAGLTFADNLAKAAINADATTQSTNLFDQEMKKINLEIEKWSGRTSAQVTLEREVAAETERLTKIFGAQPAKLEEVLAAYQRLIEIKEANLAVDVLTRNARMEMDRSASAEARLREAQADFVAGTGKGTTWGGGMQNMRDQLTALERSRDGLINYRDALQDAIESGGFQGETLKQLQDALRGTDEQIRSDNDAIRQFTSFANQAANAVDRWQQSMENFAKHGTGFLAMMKNMAFAAALMIGQGMGNAFTQMFQAMMSGESAWAAFKKAMGQILIQMGEMAVSLGTIALLASFIPLFDAFTNPAAALALIAIGAGLIAAGVAMGGAGGKKTTTATGGATSKAEESRTIYMEPYFQRQDALLTQMNDTLNKMNGTFSGLTTKSPGVVVMEGADHASTVLTNVVGKNLQKNTNARTSFSKTVLGEA